MVKLLFGRPFVASVWRMFVGATLLYAFYALWGCFFNDGGTLEGIAMIAEISIVMGFCFALLIYVPLAFLISRVPRLSGSVWCLPGLVLLLASLGYWFGASPCAHPAEPHSVLHEPVDVLWLSAYGVSGACIYSWVWRKERLAMASGLS